MFRNYDLGPIFNKIRHHRMAMVVEVAVGIAAVFGVGLLVGVFALEDHEVKNVQEPMPVVTTPAVEEALVVQPETEKSEDQLAWEEYSKMASAAQEKWKERLVNREKTLNIDWRPLNQVKDEPNDSILLAKYCLSNSYFSGNGSRWVGTVKGGSYDGYLLKREGFVNDDGMSWEQDFYFLEAPGTGPRIILNRYPNQGIFSEYASEKRVISEESHDVAGQFYDLEFEEAIIPEFEHDVLVSDSAGNNYLIYQVSGMGQAVSLPNYNGCRKIDIRNTSNDLYACGSGSYYYVRPDGLTVTYNLNLPFSDLQNFVRYDGSHIEGEYSNQRYGGCGMRSVNTVVTKDEMGEVFPYAVLKAPMSSKTIATLYAPSILNSISESVKASFEEWKGYGRGNKGEEPTIEDFMAKTPLLYYENALGEWVEFRLTDIMPMAECAKPVIYLYPESETDIDVEVKPQGGFSVTVPQYDNGWRVTAWPNGRLVNRDDGQEYPYLFWEGQGGAYVEPDKYWVVECDEVPEFLRSTLLDIGLNETETADFIDFWLPRMTTSPYYRIGFHGTGVMNQIAPMSLSVTPDSVLRILMDFQGLDESEPSNPPEFHKFQRNGFTVVEWGGALE